MAGKGHGGHREPRRHPGLFWVAMLAALIALVGGSAFAYVTYAETSGPDGAVKGYFGALARSDAPAALGFGDLPPGERELLTSTVLRAQQKIAPIRHVNVVSARQAGDRATVTVKYQLAFADGAQQVADKVQVIRRGSSWRLAAAAAVTRLRLLEAGQRATVVGAAIPAGAALIFPGAVPIGFDTPFLRLAPATSSVTLSAQPTTELSVQVTAAARVAVDAALVAALGACLSGAPPVDPRCPLAAARAVPNSLRGTVEADQVDRAATLAVSAQSTGVITISGMLKVAGSYRLLNFDNQPFAQKSTVSLPLTATAFAVAPVAIDWSGEQP